MRWSAFPVAVEIAGAVVQPVKLWATETDTQVWGIVDDEPTPLLRLGPSTSRDRIRGETLSNGTRAKWAAAFEDGTRLLVGIAPGCGCGHPLKGFTPPVTEEVGA